MSQESEQPNLLAPVTLGPEDENGIRDAVRQGKIVHTTVTRDYEQNFSRITSALGESMNYVEADGSLSQNIDFYNETPASFWPAASNWHFDQSFLEKVPDWSALLCVQAGAHPVPTIFANGSRVFDALSTGLQSVLRTLNVRHISYGRRMSEREIVASAEHKAVLTVCGSECLFLAPATFVEFIDWYSWESAWLSEHIFRMYDMPEFNVQHFWQTGDVLIWPNKKFAHRAASLRSDTARRLVRRVGFWNP